MYTARSLAKLSRDGGTRRGGTVAGAFAVGAFAVEGALLPDVGVGDDVAGARVQESTANRTPTITTRARPTMMYLMFSMG
jgi:hypothetical protein